MDVVILVGRILFAAVFLAGAIGHFASSAQMSAYTESKGLRPGRLFVIGSGLCQLAAAVLVVLGANDGRRPRAARACPDAPHVVRGGSH